MYNMKLVNMFKPPFRMKESFSFKNTLVFTLLYMQALVVEKHIFLNSNALMALTEHQLLALKN